jgi:hypothetical protein
MSPLGDEDLFKGNENNLKLSSATILEFLSGWAPGTEYKNRQKIGITEHQLLESIL